MISNFKIAKKQFYYIFWILLLILLGKNLTKNLFSYSYKDVKLFTKMPASINKILKIQSFLQKTYSFKMFDQLNLMQALYFIVGGGEGLSSPHRTIPVYTYNIGIYN